MEHKIIRLSILSSIFILGSIITAAVFNINQKEIPMIFLITFIIGILFLIYTALLQKQFNKDKDLNL